MSRTFVSALLLALAPGLDAVALAQQPQVNVNELPEEVKKIRQAYLAYDVDTSLALSNDWLVSHPGDPLVLELRARSLRQLGRLEDAVKTAEQINPRSVRVKLFIAECLGANPATVAQAQALVDEVAADDPNAVDPHLTRARIYLAQGRLKEASSELNYVRVTKPKSYEGMLLSGILAEMGGANEEAARLYLQLVTKPADWERTDTHHERDAVVGLAGVYTKLQKYEDAVRLYQQLTEKMPRSPLLFAQLGMAQSMLERNADAIASFEKAVDLSPGSPELLGRLADLYRGAGRLDDAAARYKRILEATAPGPGHMVADLRLAEIHLDRSELDKAKLHSDAALTVAATHPEALLIGARVREKVGDAPAAKELYRKALAQDPMLFDAVYRLALLLARSTDATEQAEGQRLLARHQKIEPLLQDLTRTRRELEMAPRSPALLTRLAGLLNLAGEYEQAKLWGGRAEQVAPRSPSTCMQLGYISANLGDKAAALKYFERAQKALPPNAVPKLDEYVAKLKKGEELPLPMGEMFRPSQQAPADGAAPAAGAPAGGAAPTKPAGG
ncbi:MAG: tetratricopeptide repeat protein [Planctomycetes bacterium]|nr:tetratricopeptide repeat protein [Planctomycetota bacterium]